MIVEGCSTVLQVRGQRLPYVEDLLGWWWKRRRKKLMDKGASLRDRATHEQSQQAVSAVPVGIPSADLSELIAKIEAATGPDRELDVAIFRIVKPEYAGDEWQLYGTGMRHVNDSSDMRCMPPIEATVPHYTTSIDAALTLLPGDPDKHDWALAWAAYGKAFASIESGDDRVEDFKAYAVTPALAICAAILRTYNQEQSA